MLKEGVGVLLDLVTGDAKASFALLVLRFLDRTPPPPPPPPPQAIPLSPFIPTFHAIPAAPFPLPIFPWLSSSYTPVQFLHTPILPGTQTVSKSCSQSSQTSHP
eukprot:751577-Hanusia_phi.AAC.1